MRGFFTPRREVRRRRPLAVGLALLAVTTSLTSCAAPARATHPPPRAEPVATYGAPPREGASPERRLAAQTFGVAEGKLPWDEALSAAARILAGRAHVEGRASAAVDPEEIRLAQARAGAVMADFHPFVVRAGTVAAAIQRLREAVEKLPADPRRRVGLGVAEGKDGATVVLLLATVGARIDPLPSVLASGAKVSISGALVGGLREPALSITSPRGDAVDVRLEARPDGSFRADARFDVKGRWWVEVLGRDARGPSVAALLPIHVGEPIPRRAEAQPQVAEPKDVAAKERILADEANRLRRSRGLAPLIVDPVLGRVARAYAEELRATGRFAHVSAISGDVRARLERSGYAFARAGENLAQAPTAKQAHRSLVQSPAHLAVLTHPSWREAGFGVALVDPDGATPSVIVVEVFAAQ